MGRAMNLLGNPFVATAPKALATARLAIARARRPWAPRPAERDYIARSETFIGCDKVETDARARLSPGDGKQLPRLPNDREASVFLRVALNATRADGQDVRRPAQSRGHPGKVFASSPQHPGWAIPRSTARISAIAEKARRARRSLDAPAPPHALHMPSHIFHPAGY